MSTTWPETPEDRKIRKARVHVHRDGDGVPLTRFDMAHGHHCVFCNEVEWADRTSFYDEGCEECGKPHTRCACPNPRNPKEDER